jgi:hypothetical protein
LERIDAFRQGLHELGYVWTAKYSVVEYRSGEGELGSEDALAPEVLRH